VENEVIAGQEGTVLLLLVGSKTSGRRVNEGRTLSLSKLR
jgi:hypothetical protein